MLAPLRGLLCSASIEMKEYRTPMPGEPLILTIDQGTTNTKAILVDGGGVIRSVASRPVAISYPREAWVEQDAEQIRDSVRGAVDDCIEATNAADIVAIGISNQRESAVAWDRVSGGPIGPVVTWQCQRSADFCAGLRRDGHSDEVRRLTGLPLDAMFTASKFRWLLDATTDGHSRAEAGDIKVGTVDSWLLWNLTGGAEHRTDASNASRTQLLDIATGSWSPTLLEMFGVPAAALPRVSPSSAIVGETVAFGNLPAGIPIGSLIGDSHAALFGHRVYAPGSVKATYGTGSSLMSLTDGLVRSDDGLASTLAWGLAENAHALEGNIYVTGAAVEWTAGLLGLSDAGEVATLAEQATDTGGVYLVPAFVGLGAPHWDDEARGTLSGLTRGTERSAIARAAIESIAFQVRDVFEAMRPAAGGSLSVLRADGGVTRNERLMQFQADILGVPVERDDTPELSAMGAAYLAGLAVGVWFSTKELEALPRTSKRFEPRLSGDDVARLTDGWDRAVARTRLRFD
jgi:glycerol kinase